MFKYFKSLEENSYSLSINYFQKVSDTNIMTYSYDPDNILTTIGKTSTKKNTNPMFRLLCGDTLISSYEEGTTLIISLKIVFNTKEEKEQFDTKIGIKIGSFIDATTTISQYSSQYNLNGKVSLLGFNLEAILLNCQNYSLHQSLIAILKTPKLAKIQLKILKTMFRIYSQHNLKKMNQEYGQVK